MENTVEFWEHIRINDHAIKLEKSKLLLLGPIYSLRLVELKMLKTYIETNLANSFFYPSKFLVGALIFLIRSRMGASTFV